MAVAATSSGIVNRMVRAARLEVPLYEEVEADVAATNQALLVVVIAAACAGIGAAIANGVNPIGALIGGILQALIGWAVWSFVVYFVGTRFMSGTATYGELLRTLGFAQSPGVLLILGFLPVVGGIVSLVVAIWSLVTGFIATRQALDIDNTKTVITILIGLVALAIAFTIVAAIFGAIFGLGMLVGRTL